MSGSSTSLSSSSSDSSVNSPPAPSFSPKSLLPFVVLFLMITVDWNKETNIFIARLAFVIVQITTIIIYVLVYFKIFKSTSNVETKDEDKIKVVQQPSWNDPPNSPKFQLMTTQEYDFSQLKKFAQSTIMSTLITVFLHYKWGIVPPLLSQAILGLSSLYSNPLVKLYLLDEVLVRPWEQEGESPFLQKMLQQYMDPPEESDTTKKITQGDEVEEVEEVEDQIEDQIEEQNEEVEKSEEGVEKSEEVGEEEEGDETIPSKKNNKTTKEDLNQNGEVTRNTNTSHVRKRKGKKRHQKQ